MNAVNAKGYAWRTDMETEIKVGTMIMRDDLVLPKAVAIQSATYCSGWRRISGISSTMLDRALLTAGWNRFYIAGALQTLELGNGNNACLRRGIARLAARTRASNFNCLQVTGISRKSSFGVPFVSFNANACHIQEGSAIVVAVPTAGNRRSRFMKMMW